MLQWIFIYFIVAQLTVAEILWHNNEFSHMKIVRFSDNFSNLHNSKLVTARSKRSPISPDIEVTINTIGESSSQEALIHWSGSRSNESSDAVFILTRHWLPNGTVGSSTIYRSIDFGATFQEIVVNNKSTHFVIDSFYDCPVNKNNLVFTATYQSALFWTSNEGNTLQHQAIPFRPDVIRFHPTKDQWLLGYDYSSRKLWISKNLGQAWKIVSSNVNLPFFWGDPSIDMKDNHDVIFLQTEESTSDGARFRACHEPLDTGTCNDQNLDLTLGMVDPNAMLVLGRYIFLKKTNATRHSSLYISYQREMFRLAVFPPDVLPVTFHILDNTEDQVFVGAQERGARRQDLFLSDARGEYFTRSLTDVDTFLGWSGTFYVDVVQVQGLKGTYLANQRQAGGGTQTLITRNKGADWSVLRPPVGTGPCVCRKNSKNCSLHLHLTSGKAPAPLSEENAPGLILASGWTGNASTAPGPLCSFLSSDGGLNWKVTHSSAMHFSIVDQGSAVIAANLKDIDTIHYTLNEGQSWKDYKFLPSKNVIKMQVDALANEPGIASRITSLFGHKLKADGKPDGGWMIARFNVSGIYFRACAEKDFALWPHESKLECSMGQRIQYERRSSATPCYIGTRHKARVVNGTCACTLEDYECDFGFSRLSFLGPLKCLKASWFSNSAQKPPGACPQGEQWYHSQGYRKVASDQCQESGRPVVPKGQAKDCPVRAPRGLELAVTGKQHVSVGETVTFLLSQRAGSIASTTYEWQFGSSGMTKKIEGLTKAAVQKKSFSQSGFYNVTVKACLARLPCAYAAITVNVMDRIALLEPVVPGLRVGQAASLRVDVLKSDGFLPSVGECVYVWYFGYRPDDKDSYLDAPPSFTTENKKTHVFDRPGEYKVSVEVFNLVSSKFKTFTVYVYANMLTAYLGFNDSSISRPYLLSSRWRTSIAEQLENQISELLNIDPARIRAVTEETGPSSQDHTEILLTVLPADIRGELNQQQILNKINEAVQNRRLFAVVRSTIIAVNKMQVKDDSSGPPKSSSSHMAVAVAVPVLISAFSIAVFIFYYYRSRFRAARLRRYRRVNEQNGAGESLIDSAEDAGPVAVRDAVGELEEDDEPPLDIRTSLGESDEPFEPEDDEEMGPFSGPL